jgi:hypothetical protein
MERSSASRARRRLGHWLRLGAFFLVTLYLGVSFLPIAQPE